MSWFPSKKQQHKGMNPYRSVWVPSRDHSPIRRLPTISQSPLPLPEMPSIQPKRHSRPMAHLPTTRLLLPSVSLPVSPPSGEKSPLPLPGSSRTQCSEPSVIPSLTEVSSASCWWPEPPLHLIRPPVCAANSRRSTCSRSSQEISSRVSSPRE